MPEATTTATQPPLAVGALAALALAPVLAVGGVVKAGNNHEVAK